MFAHPRNQLWRHSIVFPTRLLDILATEVVKTSGLRELGEKHEREWCAHPRGLTSILENDKDMPASPPSVQWNSNWQRDNWGDDNDSVDGEEE